MRYTAVMTNEFQDRWSETCDTLLPLLMTSNVFIARARQAQRGFTMGVIEKDGVEAFQLRDEHWVSTAALGSQKAKMNGTGTL